MALTNIVFSVQNILEFAPILRKLLVWRWHEGHNKRLVPGLLQNVLRALDLLGWTFVQPEQSEYDAAFPIILQLRPGSVVQQEQYNCESVEVQYFQHQVRESIRTTLWQRRGTRRWRGLGLPV